MIIYKTLSFGLYQPSCTSDPKDTVSPDGYRMFKFHIKEIKKNITKSFCYLTYVPNGFLHKVESKGIYKCAYDNDSVENRCGSYPLERKIESIKIKNVSQKIEPEKVEVPKEKPPIIDHLE